MATVKIDTQTDPDGLLCDCDAVHVIIGNHELSMPQFSELVRQVLSSSDLVENDSRLQLIQDIRESMVKVGDAPGRQRIAFGLIRRVSRRKMRGRLKSIGF